MKKYNLSLKEYWQKSFSFEKRKTDYVAESHLSLIFFYNALATFKDNYLTTFVFLIASIITLAPASMPLFDLFGKQRKRFPIWVG